MLVGTIVLDIFLSEEKQIVNINGLCKSFVNVGDQRRALESSILLSISASCNTCVTKIPELPFCVFVTLVY